MHAAKFNRQFARFDVEIEVYLSICDESVEQVAPINGRQLTGCLTNLSAGGAYATIATFLPRETLVVMKLPRIDEIPAGSVRSRVVKVRMVDREPTYGIGLRFEDPDSPVVRYLQAQISQGAGS